jgi:hypothetical protein
MMKKALVVLVVLALASFGSMAFAADISVSGQMDFRSRDFQDLDMNSKVHDGQVDTQERVRLNVNIKADDVKAKLSIENDWDTWGRLETHQANAQTNSPDSGLVYLQLREAWVSFNLPGLPVNVTGGHQLLQLGNAWFFRSMKYGSDAWVIANQTGNNTAALVDIKVGEGATGVADDFDAYALLDVMKLNEKMTAGIDITFLKDRKASLSNNPGPASVYQTGLGGNPNPYTEINIQNVGLNFNGMLGPVNLKAELDVQSGKATSAFASSGVADTKFKGNQIVVQGTVPVNPVTINFTVARGSGQKFNDTSTDVKQYVPVLDADMHYTFMFEYKVGNKGAANLVNGVSGGAHTGFANVTALNAGAMFAASKSLSVGGDLWILQSTEKIHDGTSADPNATTNELGTEIDVKVNWKLTDNLSWNWNIGYLAPGKGLGTIDGAGATHKDPATGIQGILSMTF